MEARARGVPAARGGSAAAASFSKSLWPHDLAYDFPRKMTGGSTDLDGGRMPWGSGGPTTGAAGRVSFALGSITATLVSNFDGHLAGYATEL